MWERNLQDLIRGLRSNKKDESKFISQAIDEIRQEIKGSDMELKAAAVLKLTYLEMLGYDMSWASFYVVEVMSSPRFHLKSMGYLAATQSFEQDTDVLMLTTNSLKKDLTSNPADVAVSLNGLSHIVTPDLARDLSRDLIAMLNHSRAQIRKRAVLALYKAILKYPEALEHGIDRMREKLDDPDPGVVSAAVNVLCELARQNPPGYLSLAPQLFLILTTSSNNWMLIKIIKLFGVITPFEPRLVKKLQPPITDLIATTPAISLLYECVHTCIIGGMLKGIAGDALARTCVTKLAAFLEDPDQNLKYIALLALVKIVPSHPHLVAEYETRILSSVEDQDLSIRMRALDLISAMVNQNNLQSIVQQLLSHLAKPDSSLGTVTTAAQSLASAVNTTATAALTTPKPQSPTQSAAYRAVLSTRIIQISSDDLYANVTDFEWYLSVLIDLAYVSRAAVGPLIRDQLIDVAVRVRQARGYAVKLSIRLLGDDTFVSESATYGEVEGAGCQEVLWAAAWICGEFCNEVADPRQALSYLIQPSAARLAPETIAVYLQAACKIFGSWAAELAGRWEDDDLPEVKRIVDMIITSVSQFTGNPHVEVQERAANILQLFALVRADLASHKPKRKADYPNGFADASTSAFDPVGTNEPEFPKSLYLIQPLFTTYALNPVAPAAQASIPVPEGLDLDAWIVPSAKSAVLGESEQEVKETKKEKREKKGKGKERVGAKNGKRRAAENDSTRVGREPMEKEPVEKEPEVDELERARIKAERLERQRDDPYYIVDDRPKRHDNLDVDSIPVVRLDGPLIVPPDEPVRRISTPVDSRPVTPRELYTIDRGGDMPPSAVIHHISTPDAKSYTPSLERSTPAPPLSSFPPYEVEDEVPRASTPELIKVTRVKKKGTGKTKRTKEVASGSND